MRGICLCALRHPEAPPPPPCSGGTPPTLAATGPPAAPPQPDPDLPRGDVSAWLRDELLSQLCRPGPLRPPPPHLSIGLPAGVGGVGPPRLHGLAGGPPSSGGGRGQAGLGALPRPAAGGVPLSFSGESAAGDGLPPLPWLVLPWPRMRTGVPGVGGGCQAAVLGVEGWECTTQGRGRGVTPVSKKTQPMTF